MSTVARINSSFVAYLTDAPTGLVDDLTVRVEKVPENTVIVAETTDGITEYAAGEYAVELVAPAVAGSYAVVWRDPTPDPDEEISEPLTITSGLIEGP